MSETTNEIVEQATSRFSEVSMPKSAAAGVGILALYGAQDLTRKGVRKVQEIRHNRKVRKANEKAVEANNPPSQQA